MRPAQPDFLNEARVYVKNGKNNLSNCSIYDNKSKHGGGIHAKNTSYLNINLSTFSENFASGDGGAIKMDNSGLFFTTDSLIIKNSEILNNDARNGGALYIKETNHVKIKNNLILSNTSTWDGEFFGGAFHLKECPDVIIDHVTVHGNGNLEVDSWGGSIYLSGGTLNLTNSIFWNNMAENSPEWQITSGNINASFSIVTEDEDCEPECIHDGPIFDDDHGLIDGSPGKNAGNDGTDMGYSHEE